MPSSCLKSVDPLTSSPLPLKRTRLRAEERQQQILHGAIHYFAEKGFSGHTRELSKRLGIAQPLLYSYFKSKQDLIDQVYLHVFMGRWQPHWVEQLKDPSVPFAERLISFYRTYATATYRPEWIRIYLFAGLEGGELNRRYLQRLKAELLVPCCQQLRSYCGFEDERAPVSELEIEFFWGLHDGIFYTAVREAVYGLPLAVAFDDKVRFAVEAFLAGARSVYPKLLSEDRARREAAALVKPEAARSTPRARKRVVKGG
jgi:AcrR family transcriptional regulator